MTSTCKIYNVDVTVYAVSLMLQACILICILIRGVNDFSPHVLNVKKFSRHHHVLSFLRTHDFLLQLRFIVKCYYAHAVFFHVFEREVVLIFYFELLFGSFESSSIFMTHIFKL